MNFRPRLGSCSGRSLTLLLANLLTTSLLATSLGGCQPPAAVPPVTTAPPAAWPSHDYGITPPERRYRMEPAETRIDIVVRRAGPLASFGHDHVVSASAPEGYLLLDPADSHSVGDLRFAVAELVVDESESRRRYGLDTQPDAAAIEGTRKNLMQHVLDPTAWPWITIALDSFQHQQEHFSARTIVQVNGVRSESRQPFQLVSEGDRVAIDGTLHLSQTALGLKPFSTLGGGLRVADELDVHYHLEARAY